MNLVFIYGPAAVGKMTVGKELAKVSDYKLFHGHMTIELVRKFFDFDDPAFWPLVRSLRSLIFESVSKSDSFKGFIFTYVWALDQESDHEFVQTLENLFKESGGTVYFVELAATLDERLIRNKGEDRIKEKPSKADIAGSEKRIHETMEKHIFNTDEHTKIDKENFIKIDTTNLTPVQVVALIQEKFSL